MKVEPVAAHIANHDATDIAAVLCPLAGNMIVFVG